MFEGLTDTRSLLMRILAAIEGGAGSSVGAITVAGHYRIKSDGTWQLWNADQNKFHTITVTGAPGAETTNIGVGEV